VLVTGAAFILFFAALFIIEHIDIAHPAGSCIPVFDKHRKRKKSRQRQKKSSNPRQLSASFFCEIIYAASPLRSIRIF